ncbi:MAG: glycosyltransferase [Candidatus Hodarchaeota archaeon]
MRQRLSKLLQKKEIKSTFKCEIYKHPGYDVNEAFTNKYAIDFAKTINTSKITLTCSMIYRNRLAKYPEIAMCGSALAADLPNQDQEDFKNFMIVLDNNMSNKEIVKKLIYYLEHDNERQKLIDKGLKWSLNYTQEKYAERFINAVNIFLNEYKSRVR